MSLSRYAALLLDIHRLLMRNEGKTEPVSQKDRPMLNLGIAFLKRALSDEDPLSLSPSNSLSLGLPLSPEIPSHESSSADAFVPIVEGSPFSNAEERLEKAIPILEKIRDGTPADVSDEEYTEAIRLFGALRAAAFEGAGAYYQSMDSL